MPRLVLSDYEREKLYPSVEAFVEAIEDAGEKKLTTKQRSAIHNALMGVILTTLGEVEKKLQKQASEASK